MSPSLFHDPRPLAEKLRPKHLDEVIGQSHLIGKGKFLSTLLKQPSLPSLILWGPPGTGKTTLARLLAQKSEYEFMFLSAVLSGVKDIRAIISSAQKLQQTGRATLLFVDEIHRFNKSQQDGFLPHVESGLITLVGATTENPSFQVVAPLLSRCRVLTLNSLSTEECLEIATRAIHHPQFGFDQDGIHFCSECINLLVNLADGDARRLLNSFEIAGSLATEQEDGSKLVHLDLLQDAFARNSLQYDKDGEEHYNQISALHKSLRDSDPDGAIYWLNRMLMAGEDPLYTARRMIRFASEDIGNADPKALQVALAARDSYQMLGSPEGDLALSQAVIYLATAPKSNAVYEAFKQVRHDIKQTGSLKVPLHLRNTPTKLSKDLGYGRGYQYAHDAPHGLVDQEHLPQQLKGTTYYRPSNRGHEALIKDRLEKWRQILANRKK